MGWLSNVFENAGKGSVEEAHTAIIDALARVRPIIDEFANRIAILAHGILDRFSVEIHISLKEDPTKFPKATEANPAPHERDSSYSSGNE